MGYYSFGEGIGGYIYCPLSNFDCNVIRAFWLRQSSLFHIDLKPRGSKAVILTEHSFVLPCSALKTTRTRLAKRGLVKFLQEAAPKAIKEIPSQACLPAVSIVSMLPLPLPSMSRFAL